MVLRNARASSIIALLEEDKNVTSGIRIYCWFSVDYNTDFYFPDVIVGTFDSVHYSSDRPLGAAYTCQEDIRLDAPWFYWRYFNS
jgi:hypothetical protein